ncbi:hypothetical protein CEXT_714421, partial [Caerostris extrusa]
PLKNNRKQIYNKRKSSDFGICSRKRANAHPGGVSRVFCSLSLVSLRRCKGQPTPGIKNLKGILEVFVSPLLNLKVGSSAGIPGRVSSVSCSLSLVSLRRCMGQPTPGIKDFQNNFRGLCKSSFKL